MVLTRRNIWDFQRSADGWSKEILWYARGVAAMKALGLRELTSWRSYAAIHGINDILWSHFNYLGPAEARPSDPEVARYWNQCQHGTWYFLPWHRGYLLALEKCIQHAISTLPGAPTDWSLPYWNYYKPGQNRLPPEFSSQSWPDGGRNPLFVEQRWGPNNDGTVFVPMNRISLDALAEPHFTGPVGGTPAGFGFGGNETKFTLNGSYPGVLEFDPHGNVHVAVGGSIPNRPQLPGWNRPTLPGLMSFPPTAALDPIFYLHHANIDRMWEVWKRRLPSHSNPTEMHWRNGPAAQGDRKFSMPMPDGSGWDYIPSEMLDTTTLGYHYDDLPVAGQQPAIGNLHTFSLAVSGEELFDMAGGVNTEIMGASAAKLSIVGDHVETRVALDRPVSKQVGETLFAAKTNKGTADRVFLNLENVRGLSDASGFQVYVNVPAGSSPEQHPELLAGTLSMFGISEASDPDGEHGGQGITFSLDITKIANLLHLHDELDAEHLNISIRPFHPVQQDEKLEVGRISLARSGT